MLLPVFWLLLCLTLQLTSGHVEILECGKHNPKGKGCFLPLPALVQPNDLNHKRQATTNKVIAEISTETNNPNLRSIKKEWVIMTKARFRHGSIFEGIHHIHEVSLRPTTRPGEPKLFIHVLNGSIQDIENLLVAEKMDVFTIIENRPIYMTINGRANGKANHLLTAKNTIYTDCRYGSTTGLVPGYFTWGIPASYDEGVTYIDNQFCAISGNDGTGVVAYVVDTGVNQPTTLNGRIVRDFDFYGGNAWDDYPQQHGTHIAGNIGSTVYGFAPNVEIHAVKVLDSNGHGSFASLLAGLQYISINGPIGIINLSLGSLGDYSTVIADLITTMIGQGFVFSVAGGNDNTDAALEFPANVPGVMAVGSYDMSLHKSSFSNQGTTVTIWAPGSSILSTSGNGTDTRVLSGTSMATALNTGVLVLVRQLFPSFNSTDLVNYIYYTSAKHEITGLSGSNHNRRLIYRMDNSYTPGQALPPDADAEGIRSITISLLVLAIPYVIVYLLNGS